MSNCITGKINGMSKETLINEYIKQNLINLLKHCWSPAIYLNKDKQGI